MPDTLIPVQTLLSRWPQLPCPSSQGAAQGACHPHSAQPKMQKIMSCLEPAGDGKPSHPCLCSGAASRKVILKTLAEPAPELAATDTELGLKTGMGPLLEPLNKRQGGRSLLANAVLHHWGWGEQEGGRKNPLPPFTCCLVTC